MPTTLLLSLLCAPALAQDARVLMIGNSYTQANDLHLGVEAALEAGVPSWDEVLVKSLTRGGATLADHAAEADGTNGDTPWRQELATGEDAGTWDWVILQDQSQIPGFPESQAEWQASRDGAVILDGLIEAGGAETVLLLTWGRRDGDELNPDRYPDFLTMQALLLEGYQAYADACAADGTRPWLIPAGLTFQQVYEDLLAQGVTPEDEGTLFFSLYAEDGSHPSPAGSYLAALTAVAALTGRDGAGMAVPDGLDTAWAASLQQAVRDAVLDDPLGEIAYPWVFSWEERVTPPLPAVTDDTIAPLVYLDHDLAAISSAIDIGGTTEEEQPGRGRLWLLDGATLEAALTLSIGDGGDGEVLIAGGTADIAYLSLAPHAGDVASVRITSGAMVADTVASGEGAADIVLGGGSLSVGGGSLPAPAQTGGGLLLADGVLFWGDYTLPEGASLTLAGTQADDTWLFVDGDVVLNGDLEVQLDPALVEGNDSAELVYADCITLDPASVSLPADTELQILHHTGGDSLILNWNIPCDDCIDEDGGALGCGCSSGRSDLSVLLLILGAVLSAAHRREGTRRRRSH